MFGPNSPIAYPIGIVKAPSPIDAHIMKLAVFEFVTAKLNSPGNVINKANIEAKNAPTKITPAYAAKYFMPPNAHKSNSKDVPIIPANKTFNLLEIFPWTYNKTILKSVLETQNIEPKILAPSGVVNF